VTIAVVFALDAEWAPWRSRHTFHLVATGRPAVYEGAVGRSRARIAVSGVGVPDPGPLLDVLCAGGVDAIVAAGLAGALRAPYRCGDVIVARRAQSVSSGSFIASDTRLVDVASRCGATAIDVLVCVDRVAGRVEEKRRLSGQGDAVDMESFRILEEARRRRIPAVAIRVIGDGPAESLPLDFDQAVRPDGTVKSMNLLGQALRAPSRWPALIAFGYRQRRAVRALAEFLDAFLDTLGRSPE
jgi:nucleoside phosphorylase